VPADFWGIEYRNQIGGTNYPFEPDATLLTDTGLYLAPGAIVDLTLSPIGEWSNLGITGLAVDQVEATVWFGNDDFPKVAYGRFPVASPPARVALRDALERPAGLMLIDGVLGAIFQAWPVGEHAFPSGAATIVASKVVPTPEAGLRGILVGGVLCTGDVQLVGDNGIIVTGDDAAEEVRIDVTGEPLFRRAGCYGSGEFTTPIYLKTINGTGPSAFGGFVIVAAGHAKGGTILRFDNIDSDTIAVSLAGPAGA
jgi:hypothetical protein